ncbi:MAG TPA: hypothetical protein VIY86_02390, partial [Pirellulaceae bacterium]
MSLESLLKGVLLCGLAAAILVSVLAAPSSTDPIHSWLWLIWLAMTLHQCEEHVFTEFIGGKDARFLAWTQTLGFHITPARALL